MTESASRLSFSLDPLMAEAKRRMRKRRLLVVLLVLALGVVLGGAFWFYPPGGTGPSGPSGGNGGALSGQVNQVEHDFGGGYISAAKVHGRVLTVELSSRRSAAQAVGGFAADVLGYAMADWMQAHQRKPVTSVYVVGPDGKAAGAGFRYPGDPIGSDASPSLERGACEGAATRVPASISVVAARTLPVAGGACILKVRTSEGPRKALGPVSSALSNAVPSLRDHASLIEIDNLNGTPQIITTWFPGLGGHVGEGTEYARPGVDSVGLHG